jgi:hypothetical protein
VFPILKKTPIFSPYCLENEICILNEKKPACLKEKKRMWIVTGPDHYSTVGCAVHFRFHRRFFRFVRMQAKHFLFEEKLKRNELTEAKR